MPPPSDPQRRAHRRASVPAVTYPPELPVSQARAELAAAIGDHQVVVVAGETGSGKTTQLPKLCLDLGRGVDGMIGHTQPRRIAARTVAQRIAAELGVDLGQQVGYQVRFGDQTSAATLVKVMTDGILLAEISRDPDLAAYDTIILDEAHERSLTIDFLLGYLHRLLPRRDDLKLIITSATIDPQRFAVHFGDAPIIEVSGRTYPVEVRYRPLVDPDDPDAEERDQVQGICDAVEELVAHSPGDVLVFLSGEREIRDAADALRAMALRDTEVLPLYARLSTPEQQRVFQPHSGRRVVLATNVAETSLTVPGIRFVVDPGTARVSRYSLRTKVQRLPIEPISQASADQRKGRCGRVAAGICIRLYAADDFDARPAYTEPEILRTNLAAVLLQMTALGLGDIADFPFLDPPDQRSVRDATALLHELGAVEGTDGCVSAGVAGQPAGADGPGQPAGADGPGQQARLTTVGRRLARLPVDPRLGRMLLAADGDGCLREALVIVAALAIQDPRERPTAHRHAADQLHGRFAEDGSDFLAYVRLWEYLRDVQRELSSAAFRRRCKAEFLHYLRVREWQDLHAQLRRAAKDLGLRRNDTPAEPDTVHRALLTGLLSQIGLREGDTRSYLGPRGTRLTIWPGSGLARTPPSWLMAAELVETSQLWARTVARIDPRWAEQLAPHLVQRTHGDPRWSAKRGAAVTTERVTLYGLPVVPGRTVGYAAIDPAAARAAFLQHAMVEGDWRGAPPLVADNRSLLDERTELEHRARRNDLAIDDDMLLRFYDTRVPADVVSARHFEAWWRRTRGAQPDLLTASRAALGGAAAAVSAEDYPDTWEQDGVVLPLTYRFDPGATDDGVTVQVPLAVLGRLRPDRFDWHVPGLRDELVTALLRGLPKDLRRRLGPVPDLVGRVREQLDPRGGPLLAVLAAALRAAAGVVVPAAAWRPERLPPYLRIRFLVADGGRTVADGRDLAALQTELAGALRAAMAASGDDREVRGATRWVFGTLPRTVRRQRDGHTVEGYPALVDEGATAGVRVLSSAAEQRHAMGRGTRRLLLLAVPTPARAVSDRLDRNTKLLLTRSPHGSVAALLDDCAAAAVDALVGAHGGPAWDAEGFAKLRAAVAGDLEAAVVEIVTTVADILAAGFDVQGLVDGLGDSPTLAPATDDVRAHLRRLLHPGFVTATGRARLPDLVRYLRADQHRLARLRQGPRVGAARLPDQAVGTRNRLVPPRHLQRDLARATRVDLVLKEYEALRALLPAADDGAAAEVRWMVEEFRVSLHAQHLGTRGTISEQRIFRAIADRTP